MGTVEIGTVVVFDHPEATKEQALKILEESAETVEAFKAWDKSKSKMDEVLLKSEITDVIQACANLIYALGITDFTDEMKACKRRNIDRGRITVEEPVPELKPCPFCGGEAAIEGGGDETTVLCNNPACEVSPFYVSCFSEEDAIKSWNTRAGEE